MCILVLLDIETVLLNDHTTGQEVLIATISPQAAQ